MKCGAADNYAYKKNKRYYFKCDFSDFFLIYTFYKQIDFIEKYNIKFLQESIQTDKERFKQEEEEANKVTIQDVLGTFKDEDKGYKLIISVDEDNTLIDTTRVKYQIYQKDYSLYAEGEADFIDETISGADYDFIINEDKSITVKFKFGEEIGTFEKV